MVSCESNDQIINLEERKELLLTVNEPNDNVWLQLMAGTAEIFGSELQLNKDYKFSYFSSVAVFTWSGCTLKLRRETSKDNFHKVITSSQIPKMRDLHEYIEEVRRKADIGNTDSPVTLITGPTDVGKSTLCRFLLNYAARHGRKPVFIDLDVGQSSLSITGTLGVLPIHNQSDVNGKFNEQSLSVYYFGYKSPGINMELYKLLLKKVGSSLITRLRQQHHLKSSGVLIDTCGWIDHGGYKLIKEIIDRLEVNMVIVLSERSLYSKLKNDLLRTNIIFVDTFKDVVTRNRNVRADNRNTSLHHYFYGSFGQLQPYIIKVNFNKIEIFQADYSKNIYNGSNIVPVSLEPNILNQVFGLSYAENIETILLTSVYGFVCIIDLDMDLEVITILSPQPGPLPTNYLLMGDITFTPKEEIV